jgi:hypothetical protein
LAGTLGQGRGGGHQLGGIDRFAQVDLQAAAQVSARSSARAWVVMTCDSSCIRNASTKPALRMTETLTGEASDSLEAAGWALQEIVRLQRREVRLWKTGRAKKPTASYVARGKQRTQTALGIRVLAESFYYHAHRAWKILSTRKLGKERTLGLSGFKAIGVRDVRNHLLEHSELPASGVFSRSWQSSGEGGVILKLVRKEDKELVFKDKGETQTRTNSKRTFQSCSARLLKRRRNEMLSEHSAA